MGSAKEKCNVDKRRDNRRARRPSANDEIVKIYQRVYNREIFHFNRQNKEKHNLIIGKKYRERKEKRKVQKLIARVSRQHSRRRRTEHTDKIEKR